MESYEKQNEEESCSLFIHQYFFAKKKNLWEKGKKKKNAAHKLMSKT